MVGERENEVVTVGPAHRRAQVAVRGAHAAPVASVSLPQAGDNRRGHYDLVYSGGLVAGFALDVELRKRTDGRKGIAHFMRQMYDEFAKTDRKYTLADIRRLAGAVAGADLSALFQRYVEGTELIPLDAYLSPLGLEVAGGKELAIRKKPQPTAGQQRLLEQILTGAAAPAR